MPLFSNARNVRFNAPSSITTVGTNNSYHVTGDMFVHVQGESQAGAHSSFRGPSGTLQGQTPLPSLNVLPCPPPSNHFTGREGALRKLSRVFAAPVFTLFSENGYVLQDVVWSFNNSFRFPYILLNASSIAALMEDIKNVRNGANPIPLDTLLVFENADPSLELDHYLPYSLHKPILLMSTSQAISRFASSGCIFELPGYYPNQQAVAHFLKSVEMAFTSQQHVATLVARAGTGKTQLALKFVSENPSRFSHVWLFDATSVATLSADFKKLGDAAGVGASVDVVQNFLKSMCKDWLLIFDNVDSPNINLGDYIPQCNHTNVIITSSLIDVNQITSYNCHINCTDLEPWEAVTLLLHHAQEKSSETNSQIALTIVDTLGYQALAVATAGAYIASTATCTLGNYLSVFQNKRKKLLNYRKGLFGGYQKTVFSAVLLCFNQLSPSTQLLMQICSFLCHKSIPIELFCCAAAFTGEDILPGEKVPAVSKMKHFLSLFTYTHIGHSWSWEDSVNELVSIFFASYDSNAAVFSLHSIIHICARETIASENVEEIQQVAQLLLARATHNGGTTANYQFLRQLIEHANWIYQSNLCTHHVCTGLWKIFTNANQWEKAKHVGETDVAYCRHYLGEHNPATLIAMSNLASTERKLSNWRRAEILNKTVLKVHREIYKDNHPDTLKAMTSLAITYCQQGNLRKAEKLEEAVLKGCREILGDSHPDTCEAMASLGVIYHKLGNLMKAKKLEEGVLKFRMKYFGGNHLHTLRAMANLAVTCRQLGKLGKAKGLEETVLKLRKEILGESHPDTWKAMAKIAETYHQLGELKKAEEQEVAVLKLCKEIFGEDHQDTWRARIKLSAMYRKLGKWEEAKELDKAILKLYNVGPLLKQY